MMKVIKKVFKNKLDRLITPDPKNPEIKGPLADDILEDHSGITNLINITHILSLLKLVYIICTIAYFFGLLFYIFATLIDEAITDEF